MSLSDYGDCRSYVQDGNPVQILSVLVLYTGKFSVL